MTRIHLPVPVTSHRTRWLRFIRHFLEMAVAMAAGMMVLGPARSLIVAIVLLRRNESTQDHRRHAPQS